MPERDPWRTDSPLFIGVAGGSGSGKTTIAESVVSRLDDRVSLIQHDAYYNHSPELSYEGRTRVNYDHPDSLETLLLVKHLASLRAGEPIERPIYDFADAPRVRRAVEAVCRPDHSRGVQPARSGHGRRADQIEDVLSQMGGDRP